MSVVRAVYAAALLGFSGATHAHSPIQGIGDFYAGFLHPLLVPSHLLCIVTFGLLVGQQGVQRVQSAVIVYFLALVIGLAGAGFAVIAGSEIVLLVVAALCGVAIAVSAMLPTPVVVAFGAVAGLAVGIDSAQQALAGRALLAALLGTGLGAGALVLYLLVFAEWFSRFPWQRIAVRVLGSWAAAAALLVGSLSLVGPAA